MLANFFGKSNPANLLVIVALFVLMFVSHLFFGFSSEQLADLNPTFYIQISVLFALLFFFYIFILSKNKLTLNNSYGFLFFVLLFGFFPDAMINSEAVLVTLLILIYIRRALSLRTSKSLIAKLFDSGFWLGIIILIDPFSVLFYALLLAGIAMFQKLSLKSFLISFIGICTPILLYFTYCFWYDTMEDFYRIFWLYTDFNFSFYGQLSLTLSLTFLLVISFLAIIIKTPKVLLIRGKFRKFWTWSILYFGLSLLYIIITPNRDGSELLAVFFPATILFTNLLEEIKKPITQNLVLLLFFLVPIVIFII